MSSTIEPPAGRLFAGLAGLLIVGSLALSPALADRIDVEVQDGLIDLRIRNSATDDALAALAAATGLKLVIQQRISRPVNVEETGLTLSEAISKLLNGGDSYQLLVPATSRPDTEDGGTGMLWIFAEGSGSVYMVDYLETVLLRGSLAEQKSAIRSLRDLGTDAAANAMALALADDDERIRRAAMEALSGMGGEAALQALASALAAEDARTRARAAGSLGSIDAGDALAYLETALSDDSTQVRASAAEALGDLGDVRARSRLKAALSDEDPLVRERALDILEELEDEAMFHTVFPEH